MNTATVNDIRWICPDCHKNNVVFNDFDIIQYCDFCGSPTLLERNAENRKENEIDKRTGFPND